MFANLLYEFYQKYRQRDTIKNCRDFKTIRATNISDENHTISYSSTKSLLV